MSVAGGSELAAGLQVLRAVAVGSRLGLEDCLLPRLRDPGEGVGLVFVRELAVVSTVQHHTQ